MIHKRHTTAFNREALALAKKIEVNEATFEYIETVNDPIRQHSNLGNVSPGAFKAAFTAPPVFICWGEDHYYSSG